MEIILSKKAQADIDYWKKIYNTAVQERIIELKNSIIKEPYKGIGKPEPLKHQLTNK